jgi:uncharacterized protein
VRVPVHELVGHPGATRALRDAVPVDAFGTDPWGPAEGAIRGEILVDLHLDAVVEGILVRGTVGVDLELPCARCLRPQPLHLDLDVAELFVDPTKHDEDDEDDPGYELIDDRTAIELSTLVRDALLIDLPVRVLCSEDCLGLCPTCGRDRNTDDCGHRPGDEPDPRWARLAELDLADLDRPEH